MKRLIIATLCGLMAQASFAEETDLRARYITSVLGEVVPHVKIVDVKESELPGLYQVNLESGIVYASGDAKFVLQGDLLEVVNHKIVNRTENALSLKRAGQLAKFSAADMIVFKSKTKPKHVLTIFTDVDCGFCQRQHLEVPKLVSAGITVRYVPYPRTGTDSETANKMRSVWCSQDRAKALATAKSGGALGSPSNASCAAADAAVAAGYALGQKIGVNGTPAIFTDTGKQIGGYLSADSIISTLQ